MRDRYLVTNRSVFENNDFREEDCSQLLTECAHIKAAPSNIFMRPKDQMVTNPRRIIT